MGQPMKEEPVPTKQQLESMDDVHLAVMCGRVADTPPAYPQPITDKARELKAEWAKLQTPPEPDYEKQQAIEARRAHLKTRMADFLANVL